MRPRSFILSLAFLTALFLTALMGFAPVQPTLAQGSTSVPPRINGVDYAPFNVYCNTERVQVWRTYPNGQGFLRIDVTMSRVLEAMRQARNTQRNVFIAEDGEGISMYALRSIEVQIFLRNIDLVPYNFVFTADRCGFSSIDPTAVPGGGGIPGVFYVVQPGDTLANIAARFTLPIEAISSANGLPPSGPIFSGQALFIPVVILPARGTVPAIVPVVVTRVVTVPQYVYGGYYSGSCTSPYTVQVGDTLNIISRRCGVTASAIASTNGIVNPNLIFAGQRIVIPGK